MSFLPFPRDLAKGAFGESLRALGLCRRVPFTKENGRRERERERERKEQRRRQHVEGLSGLRSSGRHRCRCDNDKEKRGRLERDRGREEKPREEERERGEGRGRGNRRAERGKIFKCKRRGSHRFDKIFSGSHFLIMKSHMVINV